MSKGFPVRNTTRKQPLCSAYSFALKVKMTHSQQRNINKLKRDTDSSDVPSFQRFIDDHPKLLVLTGAGISTGSGIPSYRDKTGKWLRREPVQNQEFDRQALVRQRYWARSILGWDLISKASPTAGHYALTRWQEAGRISSLVTQNVDGLHRRAKTRESIDLHGRIDQVHCIECKTLYWREALQGELISNNPELWEYARTSGVDAGPDGDANIDDWEMDKVVVPSCPKCAGVLKPNVVFFGGSVPVARVQSAKTSLKQSDALLVIGSSLMVFSGYRFCKYAKAMNIPIAVINQGVTRADDLLTIKLDMDIQNAMSQLKV